MENNKNNFVSFKEKVAVTEAAANNLKDYNKLNITNIEAADIKKVKIHRITAKEARAIAEASETTLKHIYKSIESEAKENRVFVIWSLYAQDEVITAKIIATLLADGYSVQYLEESKDCQDKTIKISW